MKQSLFEITENRQTAKFTYILKLRGDISEIKAPGMFVEIALPGFYLRRPVSVCDAEGDTLTLIYKTVGAGTEALRGRNPGEKLDLLTGLGNGYTVYPEKSALLIGGGVGTPPMYMLCKRLVAAGVKVTAVLGFNSADEVFFTKEFAEAGAQVRLCTADGSGGRKGFVTDALENIEYELFYACGPKPMISAVNRKIPSEKDGFFGLEERMGCGFGACMGCSVNTVNGPKRVCKDGPVFARKEIIWER